MTKCKTVLISHGDLVSRPLASDSGCWKVPKTICVAANCHLIEDEDRCHLEVTTSEVDLKEEVCETKPEVKCRKVMKLQPRMLTQEDCEGICVGEETEMTNTEVMVRWCVEEEDDIAIVIADQDADDVDV